MVFYIDKVSNVDCAEIDDIHFRVCDLGSQQLFILHVWDYFLVVAHLLSQFNMRFQKSSSKTSTGIYYKYIIYTQ